MHGLLRDLNPKQREAATAPLGPVLVLAGAGSGKTRVLIYRIAYLLKKKIFGPKEILALTFTNKAAGEMKDRVHRLLMPKLVEGSSTLRRLANRSGTEIAETLTMGTFHSVGARILRAEIQKLEKGYSRNFVIYDTEDSLRLLKQITLELNLDKYFRPQVFAYYISAAKNRLVNPTELKLDNSYLEKSLTEVYENYQKRLRESNALDFDDLLLLVCELFLNYPVVLEKYQRRFKYVLVDEYQDTNHAQYVMLKILSQKHKNLFVVGDDAQSIYGFRGANMQNILDFKKDYPKAKIVMLEQNYRSTQPILDVAHHVIKLNSFQYEKKLWTKNRAGDKVNVYEARDEMDEGEFVAKRLLNPEAENEEPRYVLKETPILDQYFKNQRKKFIRFQIPSTTQIPDLQDIVVLYRTHAQSRPLEEVMLQAGIPYQIIGGVKFYERKEIKDVLSYLRLLLNPRDLVSLSRVINEPARGIGRVTFKEIIRLLQKYDFSYRRFYNNLDSFALKDKVKIGAKDFFGLYGILNQVPPEENILTILSLVVTHSGYKENLLQAGEEGETRWENVEELFNVAAKFKNLPWSKGLEAFLEEVALMTDIDNLEVDSNRLTLMTLHSAKGLEFEKVFLVGLEEGLLPHSRSLLNPEEIAEEIRLAYVGVTRAKKELYLSYARQRQSYGELRKSIPSRIIKAIPERLIQRLN